MITSQYFRINLPRDNRKGCLALRIIQLQRIQTSTGDVFVFEGERFDFPIRRVYFTRNVKVGEVRGHHAHRTLEQILVCPYGSVLVSIDDGRGNTVEHKLTEPEKALFVGPCQWHTMTWLDKDSVLLVFASNRYDERDYIRDYEEFIQAVKERDECV